MNKSVLLLPLVLLTMHTGCASKLKKEDAATGGNLPKWFLSQPEFCGIGVQEFRGNMGTAKMAAEAQARVNLSQQLESMVQSMIKSYNNEDDTTEGDFSEEKTESVSISLSKQSLNSSVPKNSYYSTKDAQFYSLVCLKTGAMTDAIKQMKQLSDAQREALARQAQKAHADLERELERYNE